MEEQGVAKKGKIAKGGQKPGDRAAWQALRAGGVWLIPKAVRRGWVEEPLQFRKSMKFVLFCQKSKPDLTRHKVGNLLANV